jgi:hypothetical protein
MTHNAKWSSGAPRSISTLRIRVPTGIVKSNESGLPSLVTGSRPREETAVAACSAQR